MLSFKSNQIEGPLASQYLPPNLGWLILTHNKITHLSDNFGSDARGMRKMVLSNNLLETLPVNVMRDGLDESL
jgi:Leucine-rich repeat (LRR) protein